MTEPEGLTARFDVDREGLSTRLAGLARSATRMHESLSVQAVMDRVVEEAVELIGAHQGVVSFTVDRNWTQAISSAYLSERYAAYRGYDEQPRGEGIYRLVCERNESMRMTQAELEAHPAWRGFGDAADRHPPMRGWLAAPLVARDGRNLGVVQLTDKAVGEFTSEDEAVLNQLAAIAAIAIENASVYERERHAAQQLQSELLPADLPRVRGLSIATRYRAGEQGARVGGDWYDVIALDDDRVAMVVGDVMGRGVSAASVMGQLRIGVRAYALQGLGPSSVLRNVDDLLQSLGGEYFATVLYAVWDLERDSVTFASAGHLPPLLRLPDRTTSFLRGKQGPPLGVDCPEFFDHQVHIPHGSALMLYTDGLVEQRDTPLGRTLGSSRRPPPPRPTTRKGWHATFSTPRRPTAPTTSRSSSPAASRRWTTAETRPPPAAASAASRCRRGRRRLAGHANGSPGYLPAMASTRSPTTPSCSSRRPRRTRWCTPARRSPSTPTAGPTASAWP